MILEQYQELRQNEFRNQAELIRMQTTKLVNMSGRSLKDGENLTPQEFWPFDWDSSKDLTTDDEGMTDEQIQAHNARLAAMLLNTE